LDNGISLVKLVKADFLAAVAAKDEGVFVSYVSEGGVDAAIDGVLKMLAAGEKMPLAGMTFTVKDNIDVKGIVTSCNCAGFGTIPNESATSVQLAEKAGAVLIGKTTMDQFATGLNGTRSPDPLCRNSIDPDYIPGGSSSGSGVSVARGLCSFSLGSDTGGSGRVPAAANGIIGLKPTIGLISAAGMIYCNRSFDCVPVFTKYATDAFDVLQALSGFDEKDPYGLEDADKISVEATSLPHMKLAIPMQKDLHFFGDDVAKKMFDGNVASLKILGFDIIEIDFAPFAEAGDMVFNSPLVAERLVDYGDFIKTSPEGVVEPVRQAIENGRNYSAADLYVTQQRLQELKRITHRILVQVDALVVPTIPRLFKIDEMLNDPLALNTIMGTYTYFANPLDLCSIAVPGKTRADGLSSSICFNALPKQDGKLQTMAQMFELR
jgi:allophanate hydrolase